MAPKRVFPAADGRPVEHVVPAANLDASRLTNPQPPATVADPEVPQAEGQGAWAWASDELKQQLRAMFRDEARAGEPSPARKFGAGFGFGAIGLHDKLGLNPHREIEKLRTVSDALNDRVGALEARPTRPRRKQKFGGRGVKKDNDDWLDRWEKDVGYELKKEGCPPKEFAEQIRERVRSLASGPAADAINERYRQFNGGKDVVSASSLRRRHPPTITTNAQGETIKVKGAYACKRWGQWEVYRNGEEPEDQLADGSTKMVCAGEDRADPDPAPRHLAVELKVETVAESDDEDNRKRSAFDNTLQTATDRDRAAEAVAEGDLNIHEGGEGLPHLSPATDEHEREHDALERQASRLLKAAGVEPSAVHKKVKARRSRNAD
jgi:hypothetical protein